MCKYSCFFLRGQCITLHNCICKHFQNFCILLFIVIPCWIRSWVLLLVSIQQSSSLSMYHFFLSHPEKIFVLNWNFCWFTSWGHVLHFSFFRWKGPKTWSSISVLMILLYHPLCELLFFISVLVFYTLNSICYCLVLSKVLYCWL